MNRLPLKIKLKDLKSFLGFGYNIISENRLVLNELLSTIPNTTFNNKNVDLQILRAAILAELDAINLYEQLSSVTKNKSLKTLLLDVAKEEKTHIGEFQAMLLMIDKQQDQELKNGKEEFLKLKVK